jgi:phenylpropionate dioxygenase-like ring-hydroxylating dioxygenase large terminal subunit
MNEKLMCDMSLTQFHLEKCGQLLFVRISPEGLSLREYLGDLFEELAILSRGVGSRIDRNILTIKANWKICVENTLESYHVGFVHTETFKKLGIVDAGFSFTGAHSTWEGTVDEALARKFEKLQQIYGRRPYKIPGYKHFLLFPATTIGTTYGSSFAFQDFHPVSQNETVFTSHVFGCRLDSLSAGQQIMVEMMNKSIVEFNRSVFEEDRVIVEYVQVGSEQTSEQSGILSDEEERVCAFQKAYLAQMAKGNVDNLVIA